MPAGATVGTHLASPPPSSLSVMNMALKTAVARKIVSHHLSEKIYKGTCSGALKVRLHLCFCPWHAGRQIEAQSAAGLAAEAMTC